MTRAITPVLASPLLLMVGACELGPKQSTQTGYRGSGMAQVVDPGTVAVSAAIPPQPYPLPPDTGGPRAGETYQNVQVLQNVSTDQFDHLMAQMNQWVAAGPDQGCNYCHNPENLASDEKYTKVVARRMLQMTRNINARWASHVQQTGVTCYTCHRGNAVPENIWASTGGAPNPNSVRGNKRGQNTPDSNVGYASLPIDSFEAYFRGAAADDIRVASRDQYPQPGGTSTMETERSYGLMMHLSSALGVNCTYCHNTQSMGSWPLSRAQRTTAYYGIRMVRDVNEEYLESLAAVFPANRKGPHGDVYKVNCTTCHQGLPKPLGGANMLSGSPTLRGPARAVATPEGGRGASRVVPELFDNPEAITAPAVPAQPAAPARNTR